MDFKIFVIGFVVFSMFYGCIVEPVVPDKNDTVSDNITASGELKKFSSLDELRTFLKNNQRQRTYYYDTMAMPMMAEADASGQAADTGKSTDYSTTNIQVEGVDEADFVKTDGEYLYVLTGNRLVIMKAYPAEDAEILSEIEIDGAATEFFINGDDLIVFTAGAPEGTPVDQERSSYYWYGYGYAGMIQYDISDRSDPEIDREVYVEGNYFDSRMIGRHVYVIVNKGAWYYENEEGLPPEIYVDNELRSEEFPDIYYPDVPAYSYRYSTVLSLDLDDTEKEPESKIYLLGDTAEMYVSTDNIYLVHQKYPYFPEPVPLIGDVIPDVVPDIYPPMPVQEQTAIHRIAIDKGKIAYQASGSVPGHILNQFSMDEYDGHFRIATTVGNVARSAEDASAKNNVYVLDMDLDVVGKVEDLAPGEKIYSARFMGARGYLVTFRKVDPLFVIDLKDPEHPEVLGKLKIPGYSDYLHPYDENHLIGLGKEAIPADEGDFSWYQGVKLSLFDVSDVENPKEIAKYEIGDRGTDSYALSDHKAFLFSKSKNLLVIPITLAEIDEEKYPAGVDPWQYGDYTFQGAYVFGLDTETGFTLKGRISHVDDKDVFEKSGYYFYSPYSVKRSLYIEDVIYTVSDSKVKMNELENLDEIKELDLPYEQQDYWYYLE